MRGLLHRLAARAAGTAVPLRSDARLPFGGGEFSWAEPAPALTADTAPASSAARVDAGGAQAPVRTRVGSEDKLPLSMVPPRLDGVEPSREPMPAATKFSPRDAEVVAPDIAGVGDAKTASHATAPLAERDPIDLTVQAPPEADLPIERVHRPPVPRAVPDPLLPTEAERSRADLAPLMPQAPAGPRAVPPQGLAPLAQRHAAWPSAALSGSADDATEVHIHIGRIDVTAVHEAPRVRARTSAKTSAISLDAYLAARSRA